MYGEFLLISAYRYVFLKIYFQGPHIFRILQKSSGKKQQYLREGSPGMIKINVRGYPPIKFEWKKNGEVVGLSERYSVARSGSLMISKVDFDDAGTYSVAGTQLTYETYIEGITVTVLGEYEQYLVGHASTVALSGLD